MESVEFFEGPEKLMEVWWTPILEADMSDGLAVFMLETLKVVETTLTSKTTSSLVSSIKTSIIRKFKNYTKVRETSFTVFL